MNGSDITDVQLVAAKPSTIRGRIVFTASATAAGSAQADRDRPRRHARVGRSAQPVRSPAQIKDDGTFEISLPPGHVLLRGAMAGPPPRSGRRRTRRAWRLSRVILNDLDVGDTGIDVPPNATIENVDRRDDESHQRARPAA